MSLSIGTATETASGHRRRRNRPCGSSSISLRASLFDQRLVLRAEVVVVEVVEDTGDHLQVALDLRSTRTVDQTETIRETPESCSRRHGTTWQRCRRFANDTRGVEGLAPLAGVGRGAGFEHSFDPQAQPWGHLPAIVLYG
jgi:hypothetical protein